MTTSPVEVASRLSEALKPFVNVRDQFPQSSKLINPKLDWSEPVTVTVTKGKFLAAIEALALATQEPSHDR
jgi:hypothetical protein